MARGAGRGALHPAARGRAGDLRRDDPRDRRRARPVGTCRRSSRRCIIHDLPVTVWWPGEPPFGSRAATDLLAAADRLVVDGSTWSGDGLERLREMAELAETTGIAVSDFALMRQSRWREAIASIFDDPDFLPYLRSLRRIAVTYATHDEAGDARLDEHRQADLPRRPGSPRASGCTVGKPLAPRSSGRRHRPGRGRRPARGRWSAGAWPRP